MPPSSPYLQAQLRGRQLAGALTQDSAQRVVAAVARLGEQLEARLAALPFGTPAEQRAAVVAARKINQQLQAELQASLSSAIANNRTIAYQDVSGLWARAGRAVAESKGVRGLQGAVQLANIPKAGAYEALGGGAKTWANSLTKYTTQGHAEVDRIVSTALLSNTPPADLARRLRPYVTGAEGFDKAFPKRSDLFAALHDHRKVPAELRGAAYRVRVNSLRIAFSEVHNARAEAEVTAFALDPMIRALRWELSPYRGTQDGPCTCDLLAKNDFYGLGPGVYPLDRAPLPPHPRCRCERIPVERELDELDQPAPLGVPRLLDPATVKVKPAAGQRTPTETEAKGHVRRLVGLFKALEAHPSPAALAKLSKAADAGAQELLEVISERQALLATIAQGLAAVPTVLGGDKVQVVFPYTLEGEALEQAKSLYKKALGKSAPALQALKDLGADVTQLEALVAAKKAAKAAKYQADKAAAAAQAETVLEAEYQQLLAATSEALQDASAKLPATLYGELTGELGNAGFEAMEAAQAAGLTGAAAAVAQAKQVLQAVKAKADALVAKVAAQAAQEAAQAAAAAAAKAAAEQAAKEAAEAAAAQVALGPADNILHQQLAGPGGSNPGGLYMGKDGVKRYVKVYADATQAHGEVLANELYRRLGLGAPEAVTFTHQGKLYYASKIIDGVTEANQLGKLGVTAARAKEALRGFAADVLTANWDAPGLVFDNLVDVGGKLYRIDNGSAFLHRAQGERKAAGLLNQITEWEGFTPGAGMKNPQYAKLWEAAGWSKAEDMGAGLLAQLDAIRQLELDVGGWAKFVDDLAPGMKAADRAQVVGMLEARAKLLAAKRAELADKLGAPAPAPVITSASPAPGPNPYSGWTGAQLKAEANGKGVYLLSKKQWEQPDMAELLHGVTKGDAAAAQALKDMGADLKGAALQALDAAPPAGIPSPALGTVDTALGGIPLEEQLAILNLQGVATPGTHPGAIADQVEAIAKGLGYDTPTSAKAGQAAFNAMADAQAAGKPLAQAQVEAATAAAEKLDQLALAGQAKKLDAAPASIPTPPVAAAPVDHQMALINGPEGSTASMQGFEAEKVLKDLGYPSKVANQAGDAAEAAMKAALNNGDDLLLAQLKGKAAAAAKLDELLKAGAAAPPAPLPIPSVAPTPAPAPIPAPKYGTSPQAQAVSQALKGKKAKGVYQIGWNQGVQTYWHKVAGLDHAELKAYKAALVKAVDGDPGALATLKALGADTAKLEQKLGVAATLPPPVAPKVPDALLVKEADVPGIQAASQLPEPLYWQGSNTALQAMKAGGVDWSKAPSTGPYQFGFQVDAKVGPLVGASKGYLQLQVVSKAPLKVASLAELDSKLAQLLGLSNWQALPKAEVRQKLLALGYDAVKVQDTGAVLVLDAGAIKVVDKAVQPLASATTSYVSTGVAGPSGPSGLLGKANAGKPTYSGVPPADLPTVAQKDVAPAGYKVESEALQYLDREMASQAAKAPAGGKTGATRYTGSYYRQINDPLREIPPRWAGGDAGKLGRDFARAIEQSAPIGAEVVTYRGLGASHPLVKTLHNEGWEALRALKGTVHREGGFASTSTAQSTAVAFSAGTKVIFQIHNPPTQKGWWAHLYGANKQENELVLNEGTLFRIVDVVEENDAGGYSKPRVRILVEPIGRDPTK